MNYAQILNNISTWENMNYAARPYFQAMKQLNSFDDQYMYDSGHSIGLYFLANAATWRGDVARETKAAMKKMLGVK